jgi:hypothetical protein
MLLKNIFIEVFSIYFCARLTSMLNQLVPELFGIDYLIESSLAGTEINISLGADF